MRLIAACALADSERRERYHCNKAESNFEQSMRDAGHYPMLSHPVELAKLLQRR